MIRIITAFIFLFAFILQTFNRILIMADYATNTAAYLKNCENKARPKMHCNGKCQMMKKLKEQEKKDAENLERKADSKTEVVVTSHDFIFNNSLVLILSNTSYPSYTARSLPTASYALLKPPPNC